LKKILAFLILLYGHLYALDKESTLKIYQQIFSSMLPKQEIRVYTKDRELLEIFKGSKKIIPVKNPEESDIMIVGNSYTYEKIHNLIADQKKDVIIFATDYHLLKEYPYIVGALYWKKGRSQLLFLKPRLEKYHITLPDEYQPFIVESL
jgi:hypothetical protein